MSSTQEERWTYMGARAGQKHAKVHGWLARDPVTNEDKELYFGKTKGRIIGGIYEVEVTRADDQQFESANLSCAKWTGDKIDDKEAILAWEAEDRTLDIKLTRKRRESNAASRMEFDEVMDQLRRVYHSMPSRTWKDRSAFIAMVIDGLY